MLVWAAKFSAMILVKRNVYQEIFRQNSIKITDQTTRITGFKMASVSKEEKQKFNSFYPVIEQDLMESVKEINVPEITKWYSRMLKYTLGNGKQRRGLTLVLSYKLLEDPKKLNEENIRLANILGWCAEMLTSFTLILDDIVDRSAMRRGVPCWYRVENVGLTAINDALILENDAYLILRKYFRDHPSYLSLVELFHETMLCTFQGQVLDHLSSIQNHQSLQHFTMDRYKSIAINKSGHFSFYFAVKATMYLAGIQDSELHRKAASILHEMGIFAQIKNDFLDCFGDVDTNGATLSGDIREGKCAWPAVVALQRATPAQRAIMEKCYGHPDEQSVLAVMDVYKELDMPTLFANYEEDILNKIRNQIEQIDIEFSKKVLYNIMEML